MLHFSLTITKTPLSQQQQQQQQRQPLVTEEEVGDGKKAQGDLS